MKYKKVFLSDEEYFKLSIGKRVIKSSIKDNNGSIPLYSANVYEPFGYLSCSNIESFDYPSILWGIDGNFELNFIKPKHKFATTDHCGTIQILDKNILPQYILYSLYILKEELSFDRNFRASLFNMKKISISIPINEYSEFDVSKQEEQIKKYQLMLRKKQEVKNQLIDIKNSEVSLPYNFDTYLDEYIEMSVGEIFDLSHTTNGSFFTKSFIRSNQGTIPVYGASKYEEEVGYGYVNDNLDNVKYFSDCLTWNIDGSIGLFYRKGKFSLSEKVIPLVFKEEYEDVLSKEYVKYAIMSEVMKNPFSFTNKGNKSRLGEVIVKIPIRDNKIDIEKQHIISQYCESIDKKNETIRVLKNDIIENVSKIINKQVIIDG